MASYFSGKDAVVGLPALSRQVPLIVVEAGAQVTMPVMDMMWGDRYGTLVDPFGHRWSVATHKIDFPSCRRSMSQTAFIAVRVLPAPVGMWRRTTPPVSAAAARR